MELSEFVSTNGFKNVIIIDDELSLVRDDFKVSDFVKIKKEFKSDIDEYHDDITNMYMKDLDPELYNQIVIDLGLEKMSKMISDFKNAHLNVVIKDRFCDEMEKFDDSIWVVDRVLSQDQSISNNNHIELSFRTFSKKRQARKKDLFVLYTADVNGLQNYDETKEFVEKRAKFEKEDDVDILYFNVVNKIEDLNTERLVTISEKAIQADYFAEMCHSVKKSVKNVQRNLYSSQVLAHMMNYNSVMEGLTNSQNLYGITMSSINNDIRILRENSDQFKTIIKKLNGIESKYDFDGDSVDFIKMRALHELRSIVSCESIDTTINEFGLDVSFGDVFLIKGAYYAVVSQQCNIVIRNNKRLLSYFKLMPFAMQKMNNYSVLRNLIFDFKRKYKSKIDKECVKIICDYLLSAFKNEEVNFNIGEDQMNQIIEEYKEVSDNPDLLEEFDDLTTKEFIKMNNEYYVLNIRKNSRELITDDYLLDVISHNGVKGLRVDKDSSPIISRCSAKNKIENAFQTIKDKLDFEGEIKTKYGTEIGDWKRIGRLSTNLIGKLYNEYIEYQTREAHLSFEIV